MGLSVCLCVCLSVKSHLTYGASVRPENAVTYSAGNEGQKICGDLPETTAFKSYAAKHGRRSQYANYSDLPAVSFLRLTHSEEQEGTQRLSTAFSLAKTMPTDATSPCWGENTAPRVYSYNARRGQFPRTRIGIVRKICCIAPRVLHFSAFHYYYT